MMPEPDFEQLAREYSERAFPLAVLTIPKSEWETRKGMISAFAEALRQVWNARGAADCAKVEAADATAEPLQDVLDAIRTLDR